MKEMKNYIIGYQVEGVTKEWTEKSGMGMINTIKFFSQSTGVSIEDIVSTRIESVETDSLISFLDNNPSDTEEQPKASYTKVQAMEWQAWVDAEQRAIDEENSLYL